MSDDSSRTDGPFAAKTLRAAIVLGLSLAYCAYVFRPFAPRFWSAGIGDWMDPYFINALLEHWYRVVTRFAAPTSPPMYFPAEQTLGYSHGLILYAPFYVPLRMVLHPFQAYNLTLFLVFELGAVCLYLFNHRILRLSFVESLLLTALFVSSENITSEATSVWTQRASVFLLPPILLILCKAARTTGRRRRLALGFLSTLLATLLYTQDFYTAHFALFFAVLFAVPALRRESRVVSRALEYWRSEPASARLALVAVVIVGGWAAYLIAVGGGTVRLLGVTLRSNDWRRPALLALVLLAVFVWRRGARRTVRQLNADRAQWILALAAGGTLGATIFLWIYLDVYLQHRQFPERDLLNQMVARHGSYLARHPVDFVKTLPVYESFRTFAFVLATTLLLLIPWRGVDRRSRLYALGLLLISAAVMLMPVRFERFSLWVDVMARLPGFGAIRDPKRVVYLYELAAVLGIGFVLARLPAKSVARIGASAVQFLLLVLDWNTVRFDAYRPIAVYERWVAAPVAIDRSCTSFFVAGASPDYMSRPGEMRFVYAIDATFAALQHGMPTLNGYSAWSPPGWELHNPHHDNYREAVASWVTQHRLSGVCEFDIDARTMKPYSPTR